MFRLHTALILVLGIAAFACRVPVPQPAGLTIAIKGKGRVQTPPAPNVDVRVGVDVGADAEVDVAVGVESDALALVEPPAPTIPVALEGAAVVEFFGIPLEGAQDVVFVFDRSGSMIELAQGQIAQLTISQPTPMNPPPFPPTEPPPLPPTDAPPLPPDAAQTLPPEPLPPEGTYEPEVPFQLQAPRKIDVAHAELVAALEQLPAGTRMNVLFFNNRIESLEPGITALEDDDRVNVIDFVWETVPYGTTALAPAMRTAFLMRAKRIVLLSDGLGNVGGDAASVIRDAREAMRGGVRIDTIGLGPDQDTSLLGTLARESGGIYQRL